MESRFCVSSLDPAIHLSEGDVLVDSRDQPSLLEVHIKASKTDVFRKGVTVILGATRHELCPVAAILWYNRGPHRIATLAHSLCSVTACP